MRKEKGPEACETREHVWHEAHETREHTVDESHEEQERASHDVFQ